MTRSQWITLAVLVPIVAVGAILIGNSLGGDEPSGGTIEVGAADEDGTFEHDYVIPLGTADRIDAGDDVEIVPRELVVQVGDAIRIVNEDDEDHIVGVFFVAAGETLTQQFNSEGVLEGECSVHPSGEFTLRVEA